jgi:hypothetical protein
MPVDDVQPSASFPKPQRMFTEITIETISSRAFPSLHSRQPTRRAARPLDSRRALSSVCTCKGTRRRRRLLRLSSLAKA